MKNPKLIIFDVDGLLLNTEFLCRKAWRDVADEHGIPEFGDVFHKIAGLTGADAISVLNNELPDIENRMESLSFARNVSAKYLSKDIKLMPGVRELLSVLEDKNIRKAVATTTSRKVTVERPMSLS